jgi:hypothetical protein
VVNADRVPVEKRKKKRRRWRRIKEQK